MKLQILVPHYRETEAVMRPLLQSIACQHCIDFTDIELLLAQDGPPPDSTARISDEFLHSFGIPIVRLPEMAERRGVSAVRNRLMDAATAEYIMFCDADDMFLNNLALWCIFNEMPFDALVSRFLSERHTENGTEFGDHKIDGTFVHGKVYRLAYLRENEIRWNEKLLVHEDSYFNFIAISCTDKDNRRYIDTPLYLWVSNPGSVTRQAGFNLATNRDVVDASIALVTELLRRDMRQQAKQAAAVLIEREEFCLADDNYKEIWEDMRKWLDEFKLLFSDLTEESA